MPAPSASVHTWPWLPPSARALQIARAVSHEQRPWVVVAPDARSLDQLADALRFFLPQDYPVLRFPDWEVLPYDHFSPLPDLVSERIATLARLPSLHEGILLVGIDTLLQRLPPRQFIDARSFEVACGQRFGLEAARLRLAQAGYAGVAQVAAPGEFALRGSLFDVFPMGHHAPLRIDLMDEEIDSIREFDPDTQRSLEPLQQVRLLPAREFPLDEEGCRAFRRHFRIRFEGDPTRVEVYHDIRPGIAPPGIEFYLPLFFEGTATLFDYLPERSLLVTDAHWELDADRAGATIAERHEQRRHDIRHPILDPAELYLDTTALATQLAQWPRITIAARDEGAAPAALSPPPDIHLDAAAEQPLAPLAQLVESARDHRILLMADSAGRRELLQDLLRNAGIGFTTVADWPAFLDDDAPLALAVAPGVGGLASRDPALYLLADAELFGQRVQQERRRRRARLDPEAILRDLQDLAAGAPVVHEEYGVGRYVRLQAMEVAGQQGEFLVIEYAGGDRIYVPVQSLHLVGRYSGADADTAPLHKLGSEQWVRARRAAAEKVRDVAADLLDLYARRQARKGTPLAFDEAEYRSFANAFPFEETEDQAEAIQAVIDDLGAGRPMDRVVCGDVGFGKTEVAMRAAFVAVQAGRQVAMLVPTTLLAEQHLGNFRDRFADLPVRIESLSRFRSGKASREILDGLAFGRIDILIATHRLLHAEAKFRDLGLLIIDEEHRFGVRDKERIKALRTEVHTLTLTATPIPRTLNMALGGLRDLSLITTPPAGRVAIKTFVSEWDGATIREACLREMRRGGQVYFVHNEIKGIEAIGADLQQLLPDARIRIGHGQMRERELEQLMVDFYHRRFDILLCTTIIESGIDVPTANTIMINRADRLGLAQLHQLRGRVGRSHHRAYAYLFIPSRRALTADAERRLEAIESIEELGAGFALATQDLEIRGAGEFLGDAQSGDGHEVGLSMYLEMLQAAVHALKEGREPELDRPLAAATEVNLHLPCLLPETYVDDVQVRLSLYKRIAAAPDAAALDELQAEIGDRFGPLPDAAHNLLQSARLTQRCRRLGVHRLTVTGQAAHIVFAEENRIDPATIIALIQQQPRVFRLEGSLKLRVAGGAPEDARAAFASQLLDRLGAKHGQQRPRQ